MDDSEFSHICKNQDGFLQVVERLEQIPVSESMVITEDITSGVQAPTVNPALEVTLAFGRVRVNFVARLVLGFAGDRLSERHFVLQMRVASSPFDTSPFGGPSLFSNLNDIETHRSRFD